MVLNPFQILLNDLNHELKEKDLQSLIHICGERIPGAQKERITSGWELFSILRQQNFIGSEPETIVNLLEIIQALRPKRKDLVHKVKQHIQRHCNDPETILKDFESSSDSNPPLQFPLSRSSTPSPAEDCCRLRCCGFACNYNPCCDTCCCCVILAVLFLFLTIAAILAWYTSIPKVKKYLTRDPDREHTGPYVVSCLGFLAACSVACVIYIKRCKPRNNLAYAVLPSNFYETTSNRATYASSECTHTSNPISQGRTIERPRRCSCSSGRYTQYTASSSLPSRDLSHILRPPDEDDAVPDGPQQEDYPEFFTQDVGQEEGEMEEV